VSALMQHVAREKQDSRSYIRQETVHGIALLVPVVLSGAEVR